jgi:hypothetical protein
MTPTTRFRYIERVVPAPEHGKDIGKTVRILQQWWEQKGMTMNLGWGGEMPIGEIKGEWRDIPLEQEA